MKNNRLRILLVDRDRDRRQRLRSKLYDALRCPTVITAISGDKQLQVLDEAAFDVCVLSLSNGVDALHEAQALRCQYDSVPIIAIDGEPEPEELEALLACGVQDHVPRRCVECPANHRLPSSIEWTVERDRLQRHIDDMHEEREQRALHDPLTGLPNRKLFADRLRHLVQRQARNGEGFAVLFIDLDRFKRVNDTLGHDVGDQLLVEVAARLKACLRGSDTCARWGGDEFLVTLEGIPARDDAEHVAGKIAESLAKPFSIDGCELGISASIGISLCPLDACDATMLIRQADLAMYRAKASGGHGAQCFVSEMAQEAQEDLRLENLLDGAVGRGELSLAFQPQVSLRTRRIVGFEALARWTHPRLGSIPPGRFIPLAEESGMIISLGEWVVGEACRTIVSWREAGLLPVPVAVNVSSRQLQRPGFEEMIGEALHESGVSGSELEIELTERTLVNDPQRVGHALGKLLTLGVRASLDDFGTGYSSLDVLGRFPFARLKIDRSFVGGLPSDEKAVGITSAIVHMARSLGMSTVAEGVEREDQLAGLLESGCEEAQGYLFSRPVAAERVCDFLRAGGHALLGPGGGGG